MTLPPHSLIGVIALPPLPGLADSPGIETMLALALADLAALEDGGANAVLIENDFDRPHTLVGDAAGVAAMTAVAAEVVRRARVPVGVQMLLNDWRASLGIAAAARAGFVRLDFFVDRVRIAAGEIVPEPERILAYRAAIGAEQIALCTDIQVKHSEPLEVGKSLAVSALQAAAHGSAAAIVSGARTGLPPSAEDLLAARAGGLPVWIGSGLTSANAAALWPLCDAAIVGTALRAGPTWRERVDERLVRALRSAIDELGR